MGRIKTANIANKQALNRKVPISASNSVSVGIKGANGHYRELIIEGVDPALVLSNMDPEAVLANIRGLLQLGINPSLIVSRLHGTQIHSNFDFLRKQIGLDINLLVPKLTPEQVIHNLRILVRGGVSIEALQKVLSTAEITRLRSSLTSYGLSF
jgi:hypothetical protein